MAKSFNGQPALFPARHVVNRLSTSLPHQAVRQGKQMVNRSADSLPDTRSTGPLPKFRYSQDPAWSTGSPLFRIQRLRDSAPRQQGVNRSGRNHKTKSENRSTGALLPTVHRRPTRKTASGISHPGGPPTPLSVQGVAASQNTQTVHDAPPNGGPDTYRSAQLIGGQKRPDHGGMTLSGS